jgi:UDP-N-acetylglucosamine acyltransferase
MIVYDTNDIGAINVVGLRRAGLSAQSRQKIRQAYRILYKSGLNTSQALAELKQLDRDPAIEHLIAFIAASKRGICWGSTGERAGEDSED